MSRLAIVQRPSRYEPRARSLAVAAEGIAEAAAGGATLVVFPEAYLCGYPAWIWRLRPGTDGAHCAQLHARMLEQSVVVARGDLAPLQDAARAHSVTVVCGLNERDGEAGGGTLYNSVVVIGADGALLNRHRKLMPTNPERMVWGFGDGSGLRPVDTPAGRVGTLICWESYMPLARYALYARGVEIYIAPTYDAGENWIGTLRHIAREGACWVVGSGCALRGRDLPADLPGRDQIYPDDAEWINPGDSVVFAPGGRLVAGPMHEDTGILYADVDIAQVGAARRTLDVVGHYSRPDVLQLQLNARPQSPLLVQ